VQYEHENGHNRLNGFELDQERETRIDRASAMGPASLNGHAAGNGHAANVAPTNGEPSPPATANSPRTLQHLREARQRQGLSVRCVAQRLNLTVAEVHDQEQGPADILLSELYRWQSVLEVPIEELLNDPQDGLSMRVQVRARMLRVMKTARALRGQARTESERRLAKLLINQLIEIMPELKEVAAWPTVGQRRAADELGRIAERPISDDFMYEAS